MRMMSLKGENSGRVAFIVMSLGVRVPHDAATFVSMLLFAIVTPPVFKASFAAEALEGVFVFV